MVVTDAVVRLLPGALGDEMSSVDESFSSGLLEYAQYTRPADYEGRTVPEVLLSGDMPRLTPGAGETPSSERLASGPIFLMRPSLRPMSAPMPASFLTGA